MHDAPPSWRWAQGSCALALWWATACSAPVSVDDADAEMPEAAPDEPPGWRAEPGVDELDVMKSDGKTLFVVRSNRRDFPRHFACAFVGSWCRYALCSQAE
jgi:hypothetical protein